VIERAVMLCSADRLSHQDLISLLPAVPAVADSASSSSIDAALLHLRYSEAKQKVLEEFTVRYVEGKLAVHGGNVTHAAQDSGIPRQHFQQIMKRYLKEEG
jgi:DNA-binding NtrC family response regulator